MGGQCLEQLGGSRERPDAVVAAQERILMQLGQRGARLWVQLAAELARQRCHEQAAAHPDPPVNLPPRQIYPDLLHRLAPGDDVLVDAVDQRPVEIEQERRVAASLDRHGCIFAQLRYGCDHG